MEGMEGWKERERRLEGARRKAGRSAMEGMEGWKERERRLEGARRKAGRSVMEGWKERDGRRIINQKYDTI